MKCNEIFFSNIKARNWPTNHILLEDVTIHSVKIVHTSSLENHVQLVVLLLYQMLANQIK